MAAILTRAAILENCAEECAELGHACLKMARKLRDENPTPKSLKEITENLTEEIADVFVLTTAVIQYLELDCDEIDKLSHQKLKRWNDRLEKAGK